MQGVVFLQINASTDNIHVIKVGDDDALVSQNGGLDVLKVEKKFMTKTMLSKSHAMIQVQSLPPTSYAAMFHSVRVYFSLSTGKLM